MPTSGGIALASACVQRARFACHPLFACSPQISFTIVCKSKSSSHSQKTLDKLNRNRYDLLDFNRNNYDLIANKPLEG
jgi:hypothetical protein